MSLNETGSNQPVPFGSPPLAPFLADSSPPGFLFPLRGQLSALLPLSCPHTSCLAGTAASAQPRLTGCLPLTAQPFGAN